MIRCGRTCEEEFGSNCVNRSCLYILLTRRNLSCSPLTASSLPYLSNEAKQTLIHARCSPLVSRQAVYVLQLPPSQLVHLLCIALIKKELLLHSHTLHTLLEHTTTTGLQNPRTMIVSRRIYFDKHKSKSRSPSLKQQGRFLI